MPFVPKQTRQKVDSRYKTIYLRQAVIDELDQLAARYNTSFNNIVVTIIEERLGELRNEEAQQEEKP